MKTLRVFAICAALFSSATAAWAQQPYPAQAIRMVVPFGPGSGADIMARILCEKLSQQMNTRVFVENRDGAGGAIGTTHVAGSQPDGYTLMLVPSSYTVTLTTPPPYNPVRDFTPISKVASLPLIVVSGPNEPYKNLRELVAYAKANPGKLSYANSGKGAATHLETELLKQRYGLDIADVPYKSFGQAITDTITGQVSFYFPAIPTALTHIKSGKVRAIAIGSPQRSEQLPDVPTVAEALGLPGYQATVWYGVLAPAATPPDIVNTLDSQIATALKSPDLQARFKQSGLILDYAPPQQFATVIREETLKWGKLVEELGLLRK